ncbi:8252_t:CDS:2 [Diversispora eburnea]|uniref:8252_t:CDS:1 n=1 Tax=Diversispora eburnea TaxID=1213867 RepID=A0A9N9D7G1_9GLOM|nr:8252_t:CDS:2 [Diversispora eburnea]
MSIKLEGSETSTVTRETRQTSQINMIFAYIDKSLESLMPEEKEDVSKVSLSTYELDNINIREAIHERYDTEIIGKDLFIKYDGGHKTKIHYKLTNSAEMHNSAWDVNIDMICVMGGNNFRPDVGIWFRTLTFAQNSRPIANSCPPPNVWIEVFYNRDPDRSHALSKIDLIRRQYLTDIEYVGIAIPYAVNPFHQNPNPWIVTTPATPTPEIPARAPYIIHLWDVNSTPVYYRMDWNEHLVLRCGLTINFTIVLDIISRP